MARILAWRPPWWLLAFAVLLIAGGLVHNLADGVPDTPVGWADLGVRLLALWLVSLGAVETYRLGQRQR